MNAITPERHQELKARIEPLRQELETWRKNKTGNQLTPETFWEGAVELAKLYGVSPVQKILRIDYRGLERRNWRLCSSCNAYSLDFPAQLDAAVFQDAAAQGGQPAAARTVFVKRNIDSAIGLRSHRGVL